MPSSNSVVLSFVFELLAIIAVSISPLASSALATPFDFDGDHRSDLVVFRPSNGRWYLQQTANGFSFFDFGQNGDLPVAADYDGDGKTDIAVYRSGVWYLLRSETSTFYFTSFGVPLDVPAPADFNGDHKADFAVFRPSTGQWFCLLSNGLGFLVHDFGSDGDVPMAGDYDGDGAADLAVFRPSNNTWYRRTSGGSYLVTAFGESGDVPVSGDFDGDGGADLAVWRPSNGTWYMRGANTYTVRTFGVNGDVPTPADYDGDGVTDISVWRPSNGTWYHYTSGTQAFSVNQFGVSGDFPAPKPTWTGATPTTTPTPTPTPTPPASFVCDYYASPTGSSSGGGSNASPWDLQAALNKTSVIVSGKTLCMKGGTYTGKFRTTLNGGTVRSAPGEWARIDGYKTASLVSSLNTTQTTFSVTDASGILTGGTDELVIGGEVIKVFAKSGNNITGSLRGASNSLNGAEPHPAGSTVITGGDAFYVAGSNAVYRDFEITNSRPSRDGNTENQGIGRGNGVTIVGNFNKLVNLVIHDNLSGVFTSGASSNSEIYGCLIYNNGMHARADGSEQGFGHGMYLENRAGYSKIHEDIVLNSFNLGAQGYGVTAPYVGGDIVGSVFSNSGSPLGKFGDVSRRNYNLIIGPDSQVSPTAVLSSSHIYHPSTTTGYSVKFGYGAGVSNGTITGNYFVGGGTLFEIANTPNANVSGNQFYSPRTGAVYVITNIGMQYSWNNNTYHAASGRQIFGISGTGIILFPLWQSMTGFDSAGAVTGSAMSDRAIVRPNAYQPGRANVLIYSFSGATTATVNLSSVGLSEGQGYTIRSAQNYFGPAIASGTYNSQNPNVAVPLNGAAMSAATPNGYSFTPASTCPQFCPMIVVPN